MRNTRKGFTLVELLIVIALIGILSASMMLPLGKTTARGKAAAIKGNFDLCRTAAMTYYAAHIEEDLSSKTADDVLAATLGTKYTAGTGITKGGVTYKGADATGKTDVTKWTVEADYSSDAEKTEIDTILGEMDDVTTANGKATFTLIPNP